MHHHRGIWRDLRRQDLQLCGEKKIYSQPYMLRSACIKRQMLPLVRPCLTRPAFDLARNAGLKITVHCGETPDDADTKAVIDFHPERLGHAVVLGEAVQNRLLSLERRIPIEICPTSNLLTLALDDHDQHPTVARWIKEG